MNYTNKISVWKPVNSAIFLSCVTLSAKFNKTNMIKKGPAYRVVKWCLISLWLFLNQNLNSNDILILRLPRLTRKASVDVCRSLAATCNSSPAMAQWWSEIRSLSFLITVYTLNPPRVPDGTEVDGRVRTGSDPSLRHSRRRGLPRVGNTRPIRKITKPCPSRLPH